jgi:hypothetical protein
MAERRPPGFNIPLNFYDGPEVNSIPKRIRAAAIGVWGLAGDYAATQLTDGYVGPEVLKQFGCTPAIRAALKVTINKKGELSPLWIDAWSGGVQLTNWPKHQRTNDEVTTYRAGEAERKRLAREAKKNGTDVYLSNSHGGTSPYLANSYDEATQLAANNNVEGNATSGLSTRGNDKTSGWTSDGRPHNVRSTKTEAETETKTESFLVETSGGGVASVDAKQPRPQCSKHQENFDGPCVKCKRRREWDEAHAAAVQLDDLERQRQLRDIAKNCPMCHGTNVIDIGDDVVRKCDHQVADHA